MRKTTYGLKLTIEPWDVLDAIPQETRNKIHSIGYGKQIVVDLVSDEPFEVFGQHAHVTDSGAELCHMRIPVQRVDP